MHQHLENAEKKIAELERQIASLQRENIAYKKLYELSPLSYQSLDENGNLLSVNQAWLRNLGYERDEVIGRNFGKFLDLEWKEHFDQNFPTLKSLGEVLGVEFLMVKKDGGKILVSLVGRISRDEDGNFEQTYCVFDDITKQRELEETLKASEERFRYALEATRDGLWDWNIETGEVYYSPRYIEILGYNENDCNHRLDFWKKLIHPDDIKSALLTNKDCIEGECNTFEIEYRMRCKNGNWKWVSGRGMAVERDKQGRATRLIGTHTDISNHKEMQEKIRASEKKMRSIFRAAPIGIGVVSERVFTEVNDRFCMMVGYDKEELLNQNSRMVYPSDAVYEKAGSDKYQQIKLTGTGTVETRMIKKNGEIIDILLSSSPFDLHNLSQGVSFTALDITKSKKTEERLRESEKKYRTMMESMIDPVYICSPDFDIEYMNPAMIKRVGRNDLNKKCYEVLHSFTERCPWCQFSPFVSGKSYEENITSPLDNRSYHISSTPINNPDGTVSKLTVFRDTTEMRQIQERLQQSQKMESIGTLAGGIAHDFNNILTAIIGYGEIAEMDIPVDHPAYSSITEVLQAGGRAADLVKQILTFSRQSKDELKPLKAQVIVKEALKLLRSSIPSTIEIAQEIDPDCNTILADPSEIHRIVMNLCTNAYHAMKEKGGIMTVSLSPVTLERNNVCTKLNLSPGHYLKLEVRDTGIGMEQEVCDRIFDPYFTTKEKDEGTGLGLAVVLGIIESMQGKITVSSKPDLGTSFEIYLPVLKSDVKLFPKKNLRPIETGNEHVLIVDDDLAIGAMQTTKLERLGYKVTYIHRSSEAMIAIQEKSDEFDLLITDMTMPGFTGLDLAKEILGLRPEMPIILCTGYSDLINEEKAKAIGISHFMMKPIDINELAQNIRESLDSQQTQKLGDVSMKAST